MVDTKNEAILKIEIQQNQNPGLAIVDINLFTPESKVRKIELLGTKNKSHA